MNAAERAAEAIGSVWVVDTNADDERVIRASTPDEIVSRLSAAGLLLTDRDRDVLNAASSHWLTNGQPGSGHFCTICSAFEARS